MAPMGGLLVVVEPLTLPELEVVGVEFDCVEDAVNVTLPEEDAVEMRVTVACVE